jgi:putative oxidoreductase
MADYTGAPAGPFARLGRLAGPTHALLRIGAGLLFMQHGAQKLFGALGGMDGQGMKAELMTQMGLAGIMEFFGGLLIAIGLLTRPVAALLFLQMLVAYFQAHMPQGGLPVQNGGELALLYALVWAYFVGNGAGPASVDAALAQRRGPGRTS